MIHSTLAAKAPCRLPIAAGLMAAACFLVPAGPCAADGSPQPLSLEQPAAGVYVHRGTHARFGEPGDDDIANIGFIVGGKCVAVVDTGGSLRIGHALRAALRNVTDKPVCYVINTHVHFDHLLGNLAFAGDEPEFVGHHDLPAAIDASREFFLEEFAEKLGPEPTENSIIGPTMAVAQSLQIDLGDRVLQLVPWPTAHSHSDLTVLDLKTGTLWTGDLLFRERLPALDGSVKGWLAVMSEMKGIDASVVIPGHGSPGTSLPEAMSAQEEYLTMLLNETRKAIAEGQFMEEAIETVGRGRYEQWLLHDQHHRTNVSRAFVELEWE